MNKPWSNWLRLVSHMLAAVFNSRAAFHREWKRVEAAPPPTGGIEGPWSGEWVSDKGGHRGALKCVLTPVSPRVFRAHFYASFSRLFRVGYVTELKAEQSGTRTLLKGEEDLGALAGGIYRCEGEVTDGDFDCRYSCKFDRGVFRLKRPD